MNASEESPPADRPDEIRREGSACKSRSGAGVLARIVPMAMVLSVVVIAVLWQADWEVASLGQTWPLLAFLAVALLVRGKG